MRKQDVASLHIIFLLSLILVFGGNFSAIKAIITEWLSVGPYNHGFLGLAMVLYVSWTKKDILKKTPKQASNFGLMGLLVSLLFLLVSSLASIQQLQLLSLFLVLVFMIASIYGIEVLKVVALPLLMLLLVLPVWNILQYPLREVSTVVGYYGANLVGVDVIRDGYRLITPGGLFYVEQACSGLGFFLVSAFLAVGVSFFNQLSLKCSVKFLIIALVFALVANWVRIIIIVAVGSYSHMQHFIVQDHLTFGWYLFLLFLVPLFFISDRFFSGTHSEKNRIDLKQAPVQTLTNTSYKKSILVLVFLLIFSFLQYFLPSRFDKKYHYNLPSLNQYQWVIKNKSMSPNWHPIFHGASHETFNYYQFNNVIFQVYVADYVTQSQGNEIIYVDNSLYDEKRWQEIKQSELNLKNGNKANLLVVQRGAERERSIAYLYFIDKQYVTDKKQAKLYEAIAAIKGKPGASIIAVAIDYNTEKRKKALYDLSLFVEHLLQQASFNRDN
jgi:EpsI family protein